MAEITVAATKDRIAADILIAAVTAGLFKTEEGAGAYKADDLAKAFMTIRKAVE